MRLNFLFARVRRAVSGIMGLAMTALPGKAIGEIYTDVEPSRPIPVAAYQHPDKQSNEQTLEVTLESTLPAAGEGVTDFANGWRIDTFGLEGDHNHWDTIGVRIYSTSNPYYEIRRVITNAESIPFLVETLHDLPASCGNSIAPFFHVDVQFPHDRFFQGRQVSVAA